LTIFLPFTYSLLYIIFTHTLLQLYHLHNQKDISYIQVFLSLTLSRLTYLCQNIFQNEIDNMRSYTPLDRSWPIIYHKLLSQNILSWIIYLRYHTCDLNTFFPMFTDFYQLLTLSNLYQNWYDHNQGFNTSCTCYF
jgi:hypothetical protein